MVSFVIAVKTFAEDKTYFSRGLLGIESGIWKPSALDDNPSKPFTNIEGAGAYYGLFYVSPTLKNFAFRISAMQWKQEHLKDKINLESVALRHISLDIKNYIIQQSKIAPYASFGLTIVSSKEKAVDADASEVPSNRAGYGVNVGAGLDFQIISHLGIAAEYQYVYAKFAKKVGLTDNYSGPKLSIKFAYLF
jgi:hypothetical protein